MARVSSGKTAASRRGQLLSWAALAVAFCLLAPGSLRTFATPALTSAQARAHFAGSDSQPIAAPGVWSATGRPGVTATEAVAEGVGAKVLHAMSAGAVAAVVQALLSSVTEPIVNRVLVKRMSVKDAMAEMTPGMIASFFTTTISTNLIKFPLFEAVAMFVMLLPDMNNAVKGLIVGFIFTTATLPITNFRYRMSIQTPVAEALKPAMLYQAYAPTVIRDMVYAIARGALTTLILARAAGVSSSSPQVLFAVVLGSCIISAPFNEIRGFLLQSAGKKLTFQEFFKPINFVRSTSLGALNQAIALGVGYWLTPIVGTYAVLLKNALDAGSWKAFFLVVAVLDVIIFLVSKSAAKAGEVSVRLQTQLQKYQDDADEMDIELAKYQDEIKTLKAANKKAAEYKALKGYIAEMKDMVKSD